MFTLIVVIITTTIMIAVNALYVAAEFSTIRARKTRLTQQAGGGNFFAQQLLPIKSDNQHLDNYIAACQLGITASSLVLGAYGQNTVADLLTPWIVAVGGSPLVAQSISATFILILFTILQVIIGELLPKSIAIQYPEEVSMATVLPVAWSQALLRPFIWFFNGSGKILLKLMRLDFDESHSHVHSASEIELLVFDSHEGGLIDDKERQMLRNTFRLRELTARQVMIPRTQLVAASKSASITEVVTIAIDAGYTRIPIYEKSIDNIIGFVHIKDLFPLYLQGETRLTSILRKPVYVPETAPILDVWQMLNNRREYMTIIFDEYGGTAGLITFEDLIEEIFGELQDEFDEEMAVFYYDKQGRTHLRADLLISDVNEYLNLELPTEEVDTLGGLVLSLLERPPEEGDEVEIDQLIMRVEMVDEQRIGEVSLKLPTDATPHIREWEVSPRE